MAGTKGQRTKDSEGDSESTLRHKCHEVTGIVTSNQGRCDLGFGVQQHCSSPVLQESKKPEDNLKRQLYLRPGCPSSSMYTSRKITRFNPLRHRTSYYSVFLVFK